MNCPTCQRDNAAARRYCGGCGTNLDPVCRGCHFVNEARDRFCGGCGDQLGRSAPAAAPPRSVAVAPSAPPPPPAQVVRFVPAAPAAPPPSTSELDGLFAATAPPQERLELPENNISQDDLDRLFGAGA